MLTRSIPKSIDDITPRWLTKSLAKSGILKNNSVRYVKSNIFGVGQGYIGTLARLTLEYDHPDNTLPQTMIAKIPTSEPKNKILSEAFWNYERENRLYEDVLDKIPIRTPRCYFSDYDPEVNVKMRRSVYNKFGELSQELSGLYFLYAGIRNTRFKRRYILLLEDFGSLDQITHMDGCSFEDAKIIMGPLGKFHAAFWESSLLDKYWLTDPADFSNLMGFLSNRWRPVIKRKEFQDKLNQKILDVFEWINQNNKKLDEYSKTRPYTLLHTDYRLDNIFFDREKNEIAVIDWQACCPGPGLFDAAYFMMNNCKEPISQEQTKELITIYHQGLIDGGVSNYSLDECLSDYPYALLLALRWWLIIIGGIEVEEDPNATELVGMVIDRTIPVLDKLDISSFFK